MKNGLSYVPSNSRSLHMHFPLTAANALLNIIIVMAMPIMQDACFALLFTEFNEADLHIAQHLPVCFVTTFGCWVIPFGIIICIPVMDSSGAKYLRSGA